MITVSNVRVATYKTSKYFASHLSPLIQYKLIQTPLRNTLQITATNCHHY